MLQLYALVKKKDALVVEVIIGCDPIKFEKNTNIRKNFSIERPKRRRLKTMVYDVSGHESIGTKRGFAS